MPRSLCVATSVAKASLIRSLLVDKSALFKKLDKEAKEVQQKLMQVPELQWIKPFCKEDNLRGSFISHLFQWIECKLLVPVSRAVSAKFKADCLRSGARKAYAWGASASRTGTIAHCGLIPTIRSSSGHFR